MDNNQTIAAFQRRARAWGGDLVQMSVDAFDALPDRFAKPWQHGKQFYRAPFTSERVGILWLEKKIIYAGDVPWPVFTHEMGHTFATDKSPDRSDELDFFGWRLRLFDAYARA